MRREPPAAPSEISDDTLSIIPVRQTKRSPSSHHSAKHQEPSYAQSECSEFSIIPPFRQTPRHPSNTNNTKHCRTKPPPRPQEYPQSQCSEFSIIPPYRQTPRHPSNTRPSGAKPNAFSDHPPSISTAPSTAKCQASRKANCKSEYTVDPSCFEHSPHTENRRPTKLYNQHVGTTYRSTGQQTKNDVKLMMDVHGSEVYRMFTLITTMYRNRNNTIPGPNRVPEEKIKELFDTSFCEFKVPIRELYKRYIMRTIRGYICPANYNWNQTIEVEIERFIEYLAKISTTHTAEKLYKFGKDDNQEWYMQVLPTRIALCMVQLINAEFDFCISWRGKIGNYKSWESCLRRNQSKQRYFTPS